LKVIADDGARVVGFRKLISVQSFLALSRDMKRCSAWPSWAFARFP
jgi:hypothetical protein